MASLTVPNSKTDSVCFAIRSASPELASVILNVTSYFTPNLYLSALTDASQIPLVINILTAKRSLPDNPSYH